jgi:hypothetical protein
MSAADRSVAELLASLCDETISPEEAQRLDRLICTEPAVRRAYLEYLDLHARLSYQFHRPPEAMPVGMDSEKWTVDSEEGSGSTVQGSELQDPKSQIQNPSPVIPPIILDGSPGLHSPLFALHSPVGGFLFSYTMSALLVGIGLLVGWTWRISQYREPHVVRSPASHAPEIDRPESSIVGRITGMVECRWADPTTETFERAYVPAGRKYALASGVMEITYETGARVILQGPAAYVVESASGGYLSLGRLTARVEKKSSGAGVQGSESPHPSSLIPHPSSLFSVRTPTAVVTDLGTEFGVEVGKDGNTNSHVFRGSVRMRLLGGKGQPDAVLRENESARAEKGDGAAGPRLVLRGVVVDPRDFVRRMVETPTALDLLDVVAGGNGRGRLRERGIDPTTGMEDPVFAPYWRDGDRQYRPVAGQKLIDGVFVPNGGAGPVQLDSAGHTFDGFRPTRGNTWGSIWSRAATVVVRPGERERGHEVWVHTMGPGGEYMPERRGLLALAPNAGLTFDLGAIRKAHPEFAGPLRFRASAGLANPEGLADIWVFVDGQLKLQRMGLRQKDGVTRVDLRLGPDDRFLTLASTDGGNGVQNDWIVFGDPILSLASNLEGREQGEPAANAPR